jgi:hypothetical protein
VEGRRVSIEPIHRAASEISAGAEAVDALLLGVEVMIQDHRKMMREANVPAYLLTDNELAESVSVLLTLARHQALDIGKHGDAIQVAMMPTKAAPAEGAAS